MRRRATAIFFTILILLSSVYAAPKKEKAAESTCGECSHPTSILRRRPARWNRSCRVGNEIFYAGVHCFRRRLCSGLGR